MIQFQDGTESAILCPKCDTPHKLIIKTNRQTGRQFLACPNYPECRHTQPVPESWVMRVAGEPMFEGF